MLQEGVAAGDNLNEMQCMWYQTESAAAHVRRAEWGEALRKCHEIDKVCSPKPAERGMVTRPVL